MPDQVHHKNDSPYSTVWRRGQSGADIIQAISTFDQNKLPLNPVVFCRFQSLFTFPVSAPDRFYRLSAQRRLPGVADPPVLLDKIYLVHPGIVIQQADVDLRPELCFCLGLATHDWTYMWLMNVHDAILHLMCLFPVHGLLLFQQMLDDKKYFSCHRSKGIGSTFMASSILLIIRISRFR